MRRFLLGHIVPAVAMVACLAGCDGDDGSAAPQTAHVETIAGSDGDGRLATEVPLAAGVITTDRHGNIYLNDHLRLRRIDALTGRIQTIAGGDRPEDCQRAPEPSSTCLYVLGIAVVDDRVYVTDRSNGTIVRVDPATGAVTLIAEASNPSSIVVDRAGNLLVHDYDDARVFRIDPETGARTTVAGTGDGESSASECPLDVPATETCLGRSVSLGLDHEGALVISGAPFLRRVEPDTGLMRATLVPNGYFDAAGDDTFVVSQTFEGRVLRADATNGATTTLIAGTADDPFRPGDVTVDPQGRVLVLTEDNRLLRLGRSGEAPVILAGNGSADDGGDGGPATDAFLGRIRDLDVAPNGDVVLAESSGLIRVISAHDGTIDTLVDLARTGPPECKSPWRIAVAPNGDVFTAGVGCRIAHDTGEVSRVAGGGATCDSLNNPVPHEGDLATGACIFFSDILVTTDGALLIADGYKGRVYRVDPATNRLAIVAGTGENGYLPCTEIHDGGDARAACLSPSRLGQDGAGNLYVLDAASGIGTRVRRIDHATGIITTVAGNGTIDYTGNVVPGTCGDGGPAIAACLGAGNMLVDADGNLFLGGLEGVREVDAATGVITTVYRDGTSSFYYSLDAIDRAGRLLFWTEESLPRVRRLTLPASTG